MGIAGKPVPVQRNPTTGIVEGRAPPVSGSAMSAFDPKRTFRGFVREA